jgi:hypothetical protein
MPLKGLCVPLQYLQARIAESREVRTVLRRQAPEVQRSRLVDATEKVIAGILGALAQETQACRKRGNGLFMHGLASG